MSSSEQVTPSAERSACIFCNIINKVDDAETEIIHDDDDMIVIRDIKPASRHHTLTIPKRHIEDVTALVPEDKKLLSKMLLITKNVLQWKGHSLGDARFGYHWPPFRSVKHLHLHCIAPESEMGYLSRMVFWKDSYWFVSPEYVLSLL